MKKIIISSIIKGFIIVLAISGVIYTSFFSIYMEEGKSLLYFTVNSNIWIAIITLVFFVFDILEYKFKRNFICPWLHLLKLIFVVSITLTFTVFLVLLSPYQTVEYLLGYSNLTLHASVPILAVIDFFIEKHKYNLKKFTPITAVIPPILYMIFVYIISAMGVTFDDEGTKFPYFFMDYNNSGWFTIGSSGIGVIYWIIILSLFVIGVSYLFVYINKKQNKATT